MLFNRCLETCDEKNEARIAVIDFLDPIIMVLVDCVDYFHEHLSGMLAQFSLRSKWLTV